MKIITWNINSVRLRANLVLELLDEVNPDVLCLQETKSPVDKLPLEVFADAGFKHHIARGFKGYNGVMILSKLPFTDGECLDMCGKNDARHVSAKFENGITVHNFYVPAGGDIPDRVENEKFGHKLDFLCEMQDYFAANSPEMAVLVGDLNIAPLEDDVWSHKQLLKTVSHTPIEVETLNNTMRAGSWIDAVRTHIPEGKVYSWWSYRNPNWQTNDKGRRLDHIWTSSDLIGEVQKIEHLRSYREKEKPSDHIPVVVTLA